MKKSKKITKLVLIGGGGHAKVVIDILRSYPSLELIGIIDRDLERRSQKVLDIPIIGDDSILTELIMNGISYTFVAIGNNSLRKKLFEKTAELGFQFINTIHPKAIVSSYTKLGQGIAIMGGVTINAECVVDDNVIINTGANIDHECRIAKHVHVAPGVTLSGNVTIGEGAFIGAGATVIQGMCIGENAIVGAGSVVLCDVVHNTTVVGVPAKVITG